MECHSPSLSNKRSLNTHSSSFVLVDYSQPGQREKTNGRKLSAQPNNNGSPVTPQNRTKYFLNVISDLIFYHLHPQ